MNVTLSAFLRALEPHLTALGLHTTEVEPRYPNYLYDEGVVPVIDTNERALGNILLIVGDDDPEVKRFYADNMTVALGGKVYSRRYKELPLLLKDFTKLEQIIAAIPSAKNEHLIPALDLYNHDENWSMQYETVIYDLYDCLLIASIANGDFKFGEVIIKNRIPMTEITAYLDESPTHIRALYGWST